MAKFKFIFLGWFLLSVQNKKFSKIFTACIGLVLEKFKKDPVTKVVATSLTVSYL